MATIIKLALAAVSLAASPAFAQAQMPHDGGTPADHSVATTTMTGSEEAKLAKCKAMPHDQALKEPGCVAAMKDHTPPPMKGGADNHNGTPHGATPKTK